MRCTSLQMFHIVPLNPEQRSNRNQLRISNRNRTWGQRVAKISGGTAEARPRCGVMEFIMRAKDSAQYHVDTLIYTTAWGTHQLYAFNYGALLSAPVASDSPAWFAGAMTLPALLGSVFVKPHKHYSSLMAQRPLCSGSIWDWAGDIAVNGLSISPLLTRAGGAKKKKKNTTV